MDMDKSYKRRIRIEGRLDNTSGYVLTVHDAETGESINNIMRIAVLLDVAHENKAVLTYHKKDEQGHCIVGENHECVEETITVGNPDLSNITALEINE